MAETAMLQRLLRKTHACVDGRLYEALAAGIDDAGADEEALIPKLLISRSVGVVAEAFRLGLGFLARPAVLSENAGDRVGRFELHAETFGAAAGLFTKPDDASFDLRRGFV